MNWLQKNIPNLQYSCVDETRQIKQQVSMLRMLRKISFSVCPWQACGQFYKLFTAVITPLVAYFSMILTELRR
jgi:hypothetical protein